MRRLRFTALLASIIVLVATAPAVADTYVPVTGSGSTWSQVALDQWSKDVKKNGITINYTGNGSSAGRTDFRQGLTDFGVSEIPFQLHPEDGSTPETPTRPFSYLPIVAGGTSFMYHLTQNGKRVENLRLSGATIAKIFTGQIKNWNDPAITADMGGAALPNRPITPVVRSDGSGTTAQFTLWMSKLYPSIWQGFSHRTGLTSFYPSFPGSKSQNGSNGVAGYVAASYGDGAITYVEYAYAKNAGYPVVKLLNKSGYYVEPTPSNVAVALTQAQINQDTRSQDYLTQILDGVYANADKRAYPLSSYSYMIVPRDQISGPGSFNTAKGKTLSTFISYFLCQGQQKAGELGYSPLPKNLVQAAYDQVAHIPGTIPVDGHNEAFLQSCNNPTFTGGRNTLLDSAPQPPECDKQGNAPCGANGAAPTSTNRPGSPTATGTAAPGTLPGSNVPGAGGAGNGASGGGIPGAGGGSGGNGGGAFAQPVDVGPRAAYGPALGTVSALTILAALLLPPLLTAFLRGRRRRDNGS